MSVVVAEGAFMSFGSANSDCGSCESPLTVGTDTRVERDDDSAGGGGGCGICVGGSVYVGVGVGGGVCVGGDADRDSGSCESHTTTPLAAVAAGVSVSVR